MPEMPNWALPYYIFFCFNAFFCSGRNYYIQRNCFKFKIIPIVSNQLNRNNNTENTILKIGQHGKK